MDQKKIGSYIAKLRNEKNMTQQELADKIGVTDRAISNWENGRRMPDLSLLCPLCKELGISINDLLRGELLNKNADKDDANILLDMLIKINKKYKINKMILYSIILTITIIILAIFVFDFKLSRFDNSYLLQIKNNISLIPLSNLYVAIKNGSFAFLIKNILINAFISIIVSIYVLQFINKKRTYLIFILLANFILEISKYLLLIGIFDIDDLIIRIIISIFIFKK